MFSEDGTRSTAVNAAKRSERLICFSHLRWNFVTQRPQHLMTRFAKTFELVFWEEPLTGGDAPSLRLERCRHTGVTIATPMLPEGTQASDNVLKGLLDTFLASDEKPLLRWYYTPMMLPFSRHLASVCTIYDCMDELANFAFAPPQLLALETELFEAADLVFTGGYSLYEAKRSRHDDVHPFPSSVDVAHFARARELSKPANPNPVIGFYGVIDERLDLELLAAVADARPDWTIEMVGPVVKISPDALPMRPNLRWDRPADYADLPAILTRWDVATMPFPINDATRFISPTKTPEYLAAGKPVVSTPIVDVARHFGEFDGVRIVENPETFVAAVEEMLLLANTQDWLVPIDAMLAGTSWDATAREMLALIVSARQTRPMFAIDVAPRHFDVLVVGAGFAGAVMAERLASEAGLRVLVVDRRPHIAGNAFDRPDAAGVVIHQYGPHIFHTNSEDVFAYLSQFTEWRSYEHRVLASTHGQLVPMPINRTTLNLLYGAELSTNDDAAEFLAARAEPVADVRTSEDVVVSAVGRELYETFFRGYTRKQWGLDPSQLDKSVTARVPTRTCTDDRYFTDRYQAMPAEGYTAMFKRMLAHPNITLQLATDYRALDGVSWDKMVYTGPVDEFFDHRFGKLPYRSLRFEHKTVDTERFQPVATVNYPAPDVPYTRITEYKHLTGQEHPRTSITYEYPCAEGDPYYPIPRAENQELYKRYETLADATPDVIFVGRLATYRYYNMDQVVGQALSAFRRFTRDVALGAESSKRSEMA